MYRKLIVPLLAIFVTANSASAQKATVSAKELQSLAGCWKGSLHYSGTIIRKPYSTDVELVIRPCGKNAFELVTLYTKDPSEKTVDTILIANNGTMLNNELLVSKEYTKEGNLEIVTETAAFDKDYNMPAISRQTYTIGKGMHAYKKEVKLKGQKEWMERQSFNFNATPCSGKK